MIGKLIGETFKVVTKAIGYIPLIGKPIQRVIIFVLENLLSAIKNLPYVIGAIVVGFVAAILFGVI